MRKLEEQFETEVVVIGVHSGKYHAERITERIRDASIRLGAEHPTVNDRQFRVWRSYAVSAWPTLAVVDPNGYMVGTRAGEFTAEMLSPFIAAMAEKAESEGSLNRDVMKVIPDSPTVAPGQLRYPGKVAVKGNRIAIADSGNHRVLIGTLSPDGLRMIVDRIAGTGYRGFESGTSGSFDSPQGMALGDHTLYVADSGNHAIRAIDLSSGTVSTVAGMGTQLRTRADLEEGALSSPWDLVLVGLVLYIAMAGVHQIWTLDIASGQLQVHAGTGGEDIRDGLSRDALLAQPMGITEGNGRLYFADAESSAIRWTERDPTGSTGTIVGTGLFDFGDVDGTGDDVRMQHQQGIAFANDGRLLVADSYNDALKWMDPATRSARSWIRGLNEPGGVACGHDYAYVADTNAHRVVAVNYKTGVITPLTLE